MKALFRCTEVTEERPEDQTGLMLASARLEQVDAETGLHPTRITIAGPDVLKTFRIGDRYEVQIYDRYLVYRTVKEQLGLAEILGVAIMNAHWLIAAATRTPAP